MLWEHDGVKLIDKSKETSSYPVRNGSSIGYC